MQTVGVKAKDESTHQPGVLFYPHTVFKDADEGILVACGNGDLHRYHRGDWTLMFNVGYMEYMEYDADRLYTVYAKKFTVHKIKHHSGP